MNQRVDAMNLALVELLIGALSFDLSWTTYVFNTNRRTQEQAKQSAKELVSAFRRLQEEAPEGSADFKLFLNMAETVDSKESRLFSTDLQLPQRLSDWAEVEDGALYGSLQESDRKISKWLEALQNLVPPMLGLRLPDTLRRHWSRVDFRTRPEFVEWSGYLPDRIRTEGLDELMRRASELDSVIVVADIRKSQEFMIHSLPGFYSQYISQFFWKCRSTIDRAGGIFDKFTGDGFIAYFNPAVSKAVNTRPGDYIADFLDCLLAIDAFASKLIDEWVSYISRVPPGRLGLAIGADHGRIEFQNARRHLVAVGEGIVWASRLAECANGGEVLINNQLYQMLKQRDTGAYTERTITPKDGPMSAWALRINRRNLVRGRILSALGCYKKAPEHPLHYNDFARAVFSWGKYEEAYEKYDEREAVTELKRMRAKGWLSFMRNVDHSEEYVAIPHPSDMEYDAIVLTAEGIEAGKAHLRKWGLDG
jgi:class 3 adenylate cyclase